MARAGDVMEDPVTGSRAVFRQTAAETNGELLQIDFMFPPHIPVSSEHIHPLQEERFEVISGMFGFLVDGQEAMGGPGYQTVAPAGVPHNFWVVGDEAAQIRFEFRPALRTAEAFETLWALIREGKVNQKTGRANPLQMALFVSEYRDEYVLARPPRPVQKVLFGMLAAVARLLGYRARHPYPYAGRSSVPTSAP